jgi:hypothetical protein
MYSQRLWKTPEQTYCLDFKQNGKKEMLSSGFSFIGLRREGIIGRKKCYLLVSHLLV